MQVSGWTPPTETERFVIQRPYHFVPPSSQSLVVKEFYFMARGISREFFVKFLAAIFPGN